MWTVIDVGNSNIKLYRVDANHEAKLIARAPLAEALNCVRESTSEKHHSYILAGSGPEDLIAKVSQALQGGGKVITLNRTSSVPFTNRYASRQAGIDRLANVAAAIHGAMTPCIVVDAGSAITVDLADSHNEFLGGYIMPGLAFQAASLHRGAARLPSVEIQEDELDAVPTDTATAISRGIYQGVIGAVSHLVAIGRRHMGGACRVIFTGGDGKHLLDHHIDLDSASYDEFLTAKGLLVLAHYQQAGEK